MTAGITTITRIAIAIFVPANLPSVPSFAFNPKGAYGSRASAHGTGQRRASIIRCHPMARPSALRIASGVLVVSGPKP